MGLRNKAHDLIVNSKTMKGINKAACIIMKVKTLIPLPRYSLIHLKSGLLPIYAREKSPSLKTCHRWSLKLNHMFEVQKCKFLSLKGEKKECLCLAERKQRVVLQDEAFRISHVVFQYLV